MLHTSSDVHAVGSRVSSRTPALCVVQVTAGWVDDVPAVRDLSFTVSGPGLTTVVGPNGSGKSTVVELVSGYLRPWSGQVMVDGSPSHLPVVRARRRVCRTTPALFALMTVRDHLVLSARSTGTSPTRQLDRAEALGLAPWLDKNAGTLSSGSAKKLWYLFCTAGDFSLIVLDEPFNTLDADTVQVVVDEITAWSLEATVLLVAHMPPDSLPPAAVIDLGRHNSDG